MRWSKFSLVVLISTLLTPVFAHASISSILSGAFDTIISIGSLSFLGFPGGDNITSFLRILMFILTFTIYFAGLTAANGFLRIFTKNIAIVISVILAIISTIFIPPAVLIASGAAFGTLISVLLLAAPILAILAIIFLLPDRPCFWWLIKLLISIVLYCFSTLTQNHLANHSFSFSANVATSLAGFWDWVLFIEFLIILYLLYKLLTCGDSESGTSLTPNGIWNNIRNAINPSRPGGPNGPPPNMPDPNRSADFSPSPPPNRGAKPPRPNQGDDPTPPKNPIIKEPKYKPIPGAPQYKPKKAKPSKEDRTLIDLSPWFLQARSQDGLGACGAFAGSSIMEYIINRVSGHLNYDYKLSELFLWYYGRYDKTDNAGVIPADLINAMLNQGDCKESLWSFEDSHSTKYLAKPTPVCDADGLLQRPLTTMNVAVDADEWIRCLLDEHPLFFGMSTPTNFDNSLVGKSIFENPVWPPRGGHAMVIVGYDSHFEPGDGRKIEAFKIRNSWSHNWGVDGYIWIPRNLLLNMVAPHSSSLYIIDGWNNEKTDKQLFTITGRAVFDDGQVGKVPSKWTGQQIVTSKKVKTPDDHAFKVAVMAQIKGQPVFLPGAETIVQAGSQGMFKIQFSADPNQFERLIQFSEFPQLHGVDFSKQAPGVIVVKKPEFEQNSDMNNWFFHIAQFKYSHAGRGGEGHHAEINPRSDIVSNTNIHFSGRPIQFGPKHVTENNVVIPVMRYIEQKTEPEVDDEKQKHLEKLALKSIHKPAAVELKWAMEESARLKNMEKALLARNVTYLTKLEARVKQGSRRMNSEYNTFKKALKHHTKFLDPTLIAKLQKILTPLEVAEKNFILYLLSPHHISNSKNPKQQSVEMAKKYLHKHSKEDTPEVEQAWMDLASSFQELLTALAGIVTSLEDIVNLTTEK